MYICPNANECVEGCYTLLFSLIVDMMHVGSSDISAFWMKAVYVTLEHKTS